MVVFLPLMPILVKGVCVCVYALSGSVALYNLMDYSLPGSFVHGILQVSLVSSALPGEFFTTSTTWESLVRGTTLLSDFFQAKNKSYLEPPLADMPSDDFFYSSLSSHYGYCLQSLATSLSQVTTLWLSVHTSARGALSGT